MLYIPIGLTYCFHFVCVSLSAVLINWFPLFYLPVHFFTILHHPVCYLLPLAQHLSQQVIFPQSMWLFHKACEQYMYWELPDVQAEFRKGRGARDQIVNSRWIKKAREFLKNIYFCFIDYTKKPLTVCITTNCGKFFKKWEHQTTLPASWEICMQVKMQQLELDMEQQTDSKSGKECVKAVFCLYYLYVPTEPSATIARPDLPTGAPVICLDIPLSLQSCQWHINLKITQLLGHSSDFSPAFEVTWPLRISLDFSPSYMCGQPANACVLSGLVKVELYPP